MRNNEGLAKRLEKEMKEAGDNGDEAELQEKRRKGEGERIVAVPEASGVYMVQTMATEGHFGLCIAGIVINAEGIH